jgi:hypothetical protein
MAKALKTIAIIAGGIALVATGIGAAAGAGLFGAATAAAGAAGTVAGVSVGTIATIASVATVVSIGASIGAQLLTKVPEHYAQGSVNRVIIARDALAPYLIGLTFFAGVLRHDAGYGADLNGVKNPYRGMVTVHSVAGPVESLDALYADFEEVTFSGGAATGYYSTFLYEDHRLGVTPETALTPHFSGLPDWGSSHKLSGKAAILWNLLFDRNGQRFASGVPVMGGLWKGVLCYDPRLDSTYPGGSGAHRIDDPDTWEWSRCPGLHALKYALGSYLNDVKVFGVGMPVDGIEVSDFVTLANVCDANDWTVDGILFEPGDRWANFKRILAAGGAEPLFRGALLGVRINAPRIAIDVITPADLTDADAEITAMQGWKERLNGIVPKYRSSAHQWDYVATDEPLIVPDYLTEDGEEKIDERQFDLVQDATQATQLAALELVNRRELGPIVLTCKMQRLRRYGPGDMLTIQLPDHGLDDIDALILNRTVDPGALTVTFTLVSESAGKYDYVMGRTGSPPPAPSLTTGEVRDEIAANANPAALTIGTTPNGVFVPVTFDGAPKGSVPGFQIVVHWGEADVSSLATYGTLTAAGVSGASVDSNGLVTVTGMTADAGFVSVPVSFGGGSGIARVEYLKVPDGAPSLGSAETADITSLTGSGTYASSASFDIDVPDGATLNLTAYAGYAAASATYRPQVKLTIENLTDAGSETDVSGSEVSGGIASVGEPEYVETAGNWTNSLGATKTIRVRFITRRQSGAGTATAVSGSLGGSVA